MHNTTVLVQNLSLNPIWPFPDPAPCYCVFSPIILMSICITCSSIFFAKFRKWIQFCYIYIYSYFISAFKWTQKFQLEFFAYFILFSDSLHGTLETCNIKKALELLILINNIIVKCQLNYWDALLSTMAKIMLKC